MLPVTLVLTYNKNYSLLLTLTFKQDGVYYYKQAPKQIQVHAVRIGRLWRQRMGHPSKEVMLLLNGHLRYSGVVQDNNDVCDICLRAKQTRNPFPLSESKAKNIFELIHCDIWGPYRVSSLCGSHYFLTIVDDYSRSIWVYLMKEKSETGKCSKVFVSFVKTQFGKEVKIIRSDNGLEFKSKPIREFYEERGSIHQTSCADTPQQNGRVERKHRHLLEVARALRFHANLPLKFWGECVRTAAYLINRTPSKLLSGKTPYELVYKNKLNHDFIKVFGCLSFAQIRSGDKFASRSRRCAFIGYYFKKKSWKLYDLENHKIFESRDVKFYEDNFLFKDDTLVSSYKESNENSLENITCMDADFGVCTG